MTSTKDLKLLSLDGGGIRGLSTLLILKRVFYVLDQRLDSTWPRPLKPCQFFDLIAGTSTGGLIAIMLGALGMTIDDCITEYLQLAPKVFEEGLLARQKPAVFFKKLNAKSRFDATALEIEIKRLVQSYCQLDPDLPLEETLQLTNSCRITVCSTHLNVTKPAQLRNYSSKWEPPVNCSIWQAARATSAAPLYFDPITFGVPPRTYGDGGLHYNNPIRILLDESKRIWNCETERRAGLIISIGTGKPKFRGFGNSLLNIVKSLEAIVTNTQETEEMFANEIADLTSTERPEYFRFNVDQGLEDIGLEEWREFRTLTEATDAYLKTHRRDIDSCVDAFLGLIGREINTPRGLLLSDLPLKTDQFFGRAAEISQISGYLGEASSSTQKRVAIHGFPGSGKTQLALEYATRAREHFYGQLWINEESSMSIEQSFMACVGKIWSNYPSFRELANRLEPLDVVRAWLQNPAHHPWLMIIDGLDDLVCGGRLIRSCMGLAGGAICVTSTHQNISPALKVESRAILKLGPLSPVDSRSLFLSRAQNIDRNTNEKEDKAISAVVKTLDGYLLAIELAGALVCEGIVSLEEFPAMYQSRHLELTKFTPNQGQWFLDKERSLFHVIEMLYKSLSTKNACAALLLTLCSVYGPWAAPMSLFQNLTFFKAPTKLGTVSKACIELQNSARDNTTLQLAVYELHRGVLAIRRQNSTTGEVENISLHGSICRWRLAHLDNPSRAEWIMQASYALANHFWSCCKGKDNMHPTISDWQQSSRRVVFTESSAFNVARLFIAPAERCIAAIKENVPVPERVESGRFAKPYFVICFYIAHIFLAIGSFEKSRGLFVEAKERMQLSSDIKDSISVLHGLAICSQQTGDLSAANEALELAFKMDRTLEQRMDDDALRIISLMKAVRDRLATDLDHQKRALIASTHPKQQPIRPEAQAERSSQPRSATLSSRGAQDEETDDQTEAMSTGAQEWTPLHSAALAGHLEVVQLLLDKGADVSGTDTIGRTPLHYAAGNNHHEVIRLLLDNGAHIEATEDIGWTPLHFALVNNHLEIIKLLIDKGADVNATGLSGWTPLHYTVAKGHLEVVKLFLDNGADINANDKDGLTPLHYTVATGYLEVVKLLLDKGADVNATGLSEWTPLHYTVAKGHLEVVKLLLDHGADINATDEDGLTPLHYTATKGDCEITRLLVDKGADVNATENQGCTPLHFASSEGHLEVVMILLDKGAETNITSFSGWTPLHFGSSEGHLMVVKLLLDKGADIKAFDNDGLTALSLATANDHLDVVELLLDNGTYRQSH